jgi:predicted nucleic acid-binding protein
MLKFPDNTQAAVNGFVEIMAELYSEDKKPNNETAEEIINKLEEKKNFIPESKSVRREYTYVLLQEYKNYIKDRSGKVGQ